MIYFDFFQSNGQHVGNCWTFSVYGKNGLRWPQMGPGGFFPTNPDLANILGRTDLDFENFDFFDFLGSEFLDRNPELQALGSWTRQV